MKIFSLVSVVFIFACCSGQSSSNCYRAQLDSLKKTSKYAEVKSGALDSLKSWIESGISASGIPPLRTRMQWKIDDAIFFNQKEDKVILMILERDTIPGAKGDYINFFIGIKKQKSWQFYFKSLPVLYVPRKSDNEPVASTFNQLSSIGVEQTLKEYYKSGTCIIKENLFNYDIGNLQLQHEQFLNSK